VNRAHAQWSHDPAQNNAIANLSGSAQRTPTIVTDGLNGVVLVWADNRNGDFDLYAQRIGESGKTLWPESGIAWASAQNDQQAPALTLLENHVYAAWQDNRSLASFQEIFVQKYRLTDGVSDWPQALLSHQGNNSPPFVGISGQQIVSAAFTAGLFDDVIGVQFIDPAGSLNAQQQLINPAARGRQLSARPAVIGALNGGIIAAWIDARNDTALMVSGMSATGVIWARGEQVVSGSVKKGEVPQLISDGQEGAVLVWLESDTLHQTDVVKAMRIDAQGAAAWPSGTVEITSTLGTKHRLRAVAGANRIFLVWENAAAGGTALFFQSLGLDGQTLFTDAAVSASAGDQRTADIVSTGNGTAVIAWQDSRSGTTELFAQQMDAAGTVLWRPDGVLLSSGFTGSESALVLAPDGLGGGIVAWQDERGGSPDIFAQRVSVTGTLGEFRSVQVVAPTSSHRWEIGSRQVLRWQTSTGVDSVRIELSRDGGATFDVLFGSVPSTPGVVNEIAYDTVSGPESQQCVVRISARPLDFIFAESQPFEIAKQGGPALSVDVFTGSVFGDSVAVTTSASDLSGVQAVQLLYKQGGAAAYDTAAMVLNSVGRYAGIIPPAVVTERGFFYAVTATDSLGNQSTSGSFFVSVRFPAGTQTQAVPGGRDLNAYRMVSAPSTLDVPAMEAVLAASGFGPHDTTEWRVFQYRGGENVELDSLTSNTFSFVPGEAFWMISARDRGLDFGAGESIRADTSASVTLRPGWNQVGNPFAFPVSWDAILTANSTIIISDPFGFQDVYDKASVLNPYQGYFIFNHLDSYVTLTIPPAEAQETTIVNKRQRDGWRLQVVAVCGQAEDRFNFVGISEEASLRWDRLDNPEPPTIGDFVSVYFPHAEWQRLAHNYTTEFRPSMEGGQVWDVEIASNIANATVVVSFPGVADIPADLAVTLFDPALRVSQDLRKEGDYRFVTGPSGTKKALQLLVGNPAFVDETLTSQSLIPADFELAQNFPNPFNPATSIRFGLPKAQRVTVRIYDLLGREVRRLLTAVQEPAGYHVVTWNGNDDRGVPVASGLYVYRITAGSFSEARKMLLVK